MKELREYQRDVLERASEASVEHSSILIVQPTGTGKTVVAVEACHRHVVGAHGRPMFVAPRRELVNQARAALLERGLEEGHDVFVRTIQELTVPGAKVPPATMVVLDEARHYVADEWSALKRALPDALCLGLDATPERGDGRGLSPFFTILLESISIGDAVEQKWLVPCVTIRPERSLGVDLAMDPYDAWCQRAPGLATVVYVRSVEEAQKLAAKFRDHGVTSEAVWGDMPTADRDRVLRDFAEGRITVLVNVQILTEGWDCPRVECILLAAPCSTQGGLLQRAGRAMRPYPGKERMILLDPTGCTHDLGDVDEPRTWHLDGKAVRRSVDGALVRFCPVCGAVVESETCISCGYGGEMRKRKPRVLGLPMDRFARQRGETDEQKAKRLAWFLADARRKGHHRYAAFKRFEGIYGHMPTSKLKTMASRS